MINAYKILVKKPEGKRQLRRPRHREKNSVNMDLKKGADWIHLPQDRDRWRALVNTVMSLRVP
jgi:hypothetical protein